MKEITQNNVRLATYQQFQLFYKQLKLFQGRYTHFGSNSPETRKLTKFENHITLQKQQSESQILNYQKIHMMTIKL